MQQQEEELLRELEILTEYQTRSRMAAESQRNREKRELEERVGVRRSLLQQKVSLPKYIDYVARYFSSLPLL